MEPGTFEVTGTPRDMPHWLAMLTVSATIAGPRGVMQVLGLMVLEMLGEQIRLEHAQVCPADCRPSPWKG